jgi:hypothetical protein
MQKQSKKTNTVFWATAILLAIFIAIIANTSPSGMRTEIIGGDGRGYYAYLPSVFMFGSLDFSELAKVEKSGGKRVSNQHYYLQYGDVKINKYTCGSALLMLPFFLISWLLALIFGWPADGYSPVFHYGILAASIFYTLLGLYFVFKLSRLYFPDKKNLWLGIFALLFGSNLFLYTFLHPSTSHVYSFSVMAMFLYFAQKAIAHKQSRDLILASFFFGLGALIRPFNLISVLLIFVLAPNFKSLIFTAQSIFSSIKKTMVVILPFAGMLVLQLAINFSQSGKFYLWAYHGEGFYFDDPHFWDVLLSYRKGLFVYSPIILLSLFGLIPLFRQSKYKAIAALAFFLVLTYFISAWWNWFYGDSFGMRPFIDFYPFFALLLAFLLQSLKTPALKVSTGVLICFFIFLNLFQSYQYQNGIIHHDAMNKEKYKAVFLKSGSTYRNALGGMPESIYRGTALKSLAVFFNDYSNEKEFWSPMRTEILKNKDTVYAYNADTQFGTCLTLETGTLFIGQKDLYIKASIEVFELDTNATQNAYFVASCTSAKGESGFYKTFQIKPAPNFKTRVWEKREFGFRIPEDFSPDDRIKFYIWNKGLKSFYVDDFEIEIQEIRTQN